MAGLGAYMLAGFAEGLGDGLVENARQMREERMRELERQYRQAERQEDRKWRTQERAEDRSIRKEERTEDRNWRLEDRGAEWEHTDKTDKRRRDWTVEDRDISTEQRELDRSATAEEATKRRQFEHGETREGWKRDDTVDDRERRQAIEDRNYKEGEPSEPFTDADGNRRREQGRGGKATPVLDENGNPVKMPKTYDGTYTENNRRNAANAAIAASKDAGDNVDWDKAAGIMRAQGIDPAPYANVAILDLRKQAARYGKDDAWVDAEMERIFGGGGAPTPGPSPTPPVPKGMPPGARQSPNDGKWYVPEGKGWREVIGAP